MSTLSSANFMEGNILLKERTQTMNNKIKLHILGVPMNKLRLLASKLTLCKTCPVHVGLWHRHVNALVGLTWILCKQ